jgi:hypothetical protein
MFTQALKKLVLDSSLVNQLTRPHGVDRYAELLAPTWTIGEAPAKGRLEPQAGHGVSQRRAGIDVSI